MCFTWKLTLGDLYHHQIPVYLNDFPKVISNFAYTEKRAAAQ